MADPATEASHASPNANMIARMVGVPGRSAWLTRTSRRNNESADQQCPGQKTKGNAGRLGDTADRNLLSLRPARHDCQDHQSDHIINDGGSEDDLTFRFLQPVQVRQHTSRDPDAGGRQRGPGNDGDKVAKAQQPADAIAQSERQGDTDEAQRAEAPPLARVFAGPSPGRSRKGG